MFELFCLIQNNLFITPVMTAFSIAAYFSWGSFNYCFDLKSSNFFKFTNMTFWFEMYSFDRRCCCARRSFSKSRWHVCFEFSLSFELISWGLGAFSLHSSRNREHSFSNSWLSFVRVTSASWYLAFTWSCTVRRSWNFRLSTLSLSI